MDATPINLHDLTREELRSFFARRGIATVHADTLWNRLYLGLAAEISAAALPGLPARVIKLLEAETRIGVPPVALATDSTDGFTRKYLLELADARRIETVLMRYSGRVTACVSSQVGCAMGCVFCATGQMGPGRNLTAGEIVAQAVHVARALRDAPVDGGEASGSRRLRNIVLMGMGEPLNNYDAVLRAVDILRDPAGLAIAAERITLSTVGIVPGILRLARERRPIHLAVSLHAATQEARAALIPGARRWPLEELMAACDAYSAATGRRIFYEWTLIAGQNDSPEEARTLGVLLRGRPAQVNLIPLNPTGGYEGEPSRVEPVRRFQRILRDEFGLPCTVRQRRGIDIAAGCGQLAAAD